MAYFGFTNKLLKGETIQIYNYGNCRRDFTYVEDIVEGKDRGDRSVSRGGLRVQAELLRAA
jgi:nucleoside-diphosphate-sugar epimerase